MRRNEVTLAAMAFSLLACSAGSIGDVDGGPGRDGGSLGDGGDSTDSGTASDAGTADDGGGSSDAGATVDAGPGIDGGAAADAGSSTDGGTGGGAAFRGTIHFVETFEDSDFGSRGWYDGPRGTLTTTNPAPGSTTAFECRFAQGARTCSDGTPGRHQFPESESVYLSYWVRYSVGWVGSERPYHPHELHFITNQDDRWVGPSHTHLTAYIEQVGGVARLALQDGRNVDTACVLRNDDSFVGCGGDFDSYAFTEARSVCSCNGLQGDLDQRDCFPPGDGTWYSSRGWRAAGRTFTDEVGPRYESDWHFVEAYFEMNDIVGGVGVPNGRIRYWLDGELLISSDAILMRTGQHPNMAFDQFLVAPYIGDGSPIEQAMWIDDLTVAAGLR